MATETIQPVVRPVTGRIRPVGSKSLTNRALVAAGLASGRSVLEGCLASDDTRYMAAAWRQLGATVDWDEPSGRITIAGTAGRIAPGPQDLFVGNAGTAMRFMTAVVATGQGRYRLDGVSRMRERPIEDLLVALRALGASAVSETGNKCPPVIVQAGGLGGGQVTVSGRISSQYLSGLLLAAPYAARDVEIMIDGRLVSKPYADMTCRLMADFGVEVENEEYRRFYVAAPSRYTARAYAVEPDATAATYFWAAAAMTGGSVTVEGLTADSAQGDVGFVRVLEQMGCRIESSPDGLTVHGPERLRGVTVDLNAMPDTALTLAVAALAAEGPTEILNVANLRVKETDRLAALAAELRKFGAEVDEAEDRLTIRPPAALRGADVATYDDHRMAMSFALAGLKVAGVRISGAECVNKTFPDYFVRLRGLVESSPGK
ncbi:MAG: 3-phosphoshikimate 1-carboxyvinyltransferase [Planctomycetes bacterium]|nr:3-phosphoshikimate 1-carboxyvinyltransferase [Planctomycetota bacterium]